MPSSCVLLIERLFAVLVSLRHPLSPFHPPAMAAPTVHDLNPQCINPNLVILFFHGISSGENNQWKDTWISSCTKGGVKPVCWPEKWLLEDMKDSARILFVSYDAELLGKQNDLAEIGKNLIGSLMIPRYETLWQVPTVLVGYSLGGFVLKSLVVEVDKCMRSITVNALDGALKGSCERFLGNLKGIVLYSVPQAEGAKDLSKYFSWQHQNINTINKNFKAKLGFLNKLKSFNKQIEQLSRDFGKVVCSDVNVYAFGEGQPVDKKCGVLLPFDLATVSNSNYNYKIEDATHLTICKPPTKEHPSYSLLLECLKICVESYCVHQLWPPIGSEQHDINFDVVFFPGLPCGDGANSTWKTTWIQRSNPNVCWPEQWLPVDMGYNVRVLMLSYDARVDNKGDIFEIAKNLVQSLVTSPMWKLGQEHPYVLIGYSFGGIVLKQLVLEVLQRYYKDVTRSRAFVENMLGVVFYAVPHAGSQLKKFIKQSDRILHTNVQAYIGVETELFEQKMAELSDDFESVLKTSPTAHVLTFAESKRSKNMGMIVDYGSARMLSGYDTYKVLDSDHIEVCKPLNRSDPSYELLIFSLKDWQQELWKTLATPQGQQHTLRTSHLKGGGRKTKKMLGLGPSTQGMSKKISPQVSQPQLSCPPKDLIAPERLRQPECSPCMKKGENKYGVNIKDHLPKNKFIPSPNCVLNPIGLPLRPGAPPCTFYEQYGICKFGSNCKFDHPFGPSTSSPYDSPSASCSMEGSSPFATSSSQSLNPLKELSSKVGSYGHYLEVATKSMREVQNLISPEISSPLQINECQCRYLFDTLYGIVLDAHVHVRDLTPQVIQSSQKILKNLAGTAKDAEILVNDCCDGQWIEAAIILAKAKEHFASLVFKLELYGTLLQNVHNEELKNMFLATLGDWSKCVMEKNFHIINEKAKQDQQSLLSRLEACVGSSDSNSQVENLIRRLKISDDRGTNLHNAMGAIDTWKVDSKSLERSKEKLGKGSSATVYKIEWLGKHFVEKCFIGPENENVRKELSILVGLSHPNIVPLFCYAINKHYCSLVMELMDGDLHDLMQPNLESNETPFELCEAVDIMLQIAEGMHYLHQNNVIHRDLKSMNILVKRDERMYAKVADFGLSRTRLSSWTYSNLTNDVGSTRWMAPELFGDEQDESSILSSEADKNYPFKVDVYSFGMVCYEIMSGHIPFHDVASSMTDLRKMIKSDGLRPKIPEQYPECLTSLVETCYHSDPTTRPLFVDICANLRHIKCSLMVC